MRISQPVKGAYAQNHNLNFEQLMGSGNYKEKFRMDMIKWSDEMRQMDSGYFCRLADEMSKNKTTFFVNPISCSHFIKFWYQSWYHIIFYSIFYLSAVRTPVTLVCDIRRKTDLEFFENNFAKMTKRIRITADLNVREKRGYSFITGRYLKNINKTPICLSEFK